jgi:hypothetical protein
MDQLWNRIKSPCMKWMTTQYPFCRQPAAPEAAVFLNRLDRIDGAGRINNSCLLIDSGQCYFGKKFIKVLSYLPVG